MRSCFSLATIALLICVPAAMAQQPPPTVPPAKAPSAPPQPGQPAAQTDATPETKLGGKNLDEWIADLQHKTDPSMRVMAMQVIPSYGKNSSKAATLISQLVVTDTDVSVRVHGSMALGSIQFADKQQVENAVQALASRLGGDATNKEDPQAIVRYYAALSLAHFAQDAKSAVPRLQNAARDQYSWEIRKAAVDALGRAAPAQGGPDTRCIATLAYCLTTDPSFEVRRECAVILGVLSPTGNDLKKAGDALAESVTKDPEALVNICSHQALIRLGAPPDEHYVAIAQQLRNPRSPVRNQAAMVLGQFGSKAAKVLPSLIDAMFDPDPEVAIMAIWSVAQMGEGAQTAIPKLKDLAEKHKDDLIGYNAKQALERIQPKAPPAKPK